MLKSLSFSIILIAVLITGVLSGVHLLSRIDSSGAPPYGESEEDTPDGDILSWVQKWERPEGPAKVAIQAGHYKNEDFPEELDKLRGNTGAKGGGHIESEVNLAIAERVTENLKQQGIEAELLPATVPPSYWSDVFVSIHADGNNDSTKSGFKIAGPWRDLTGSSDELTEFLRDSYEQRFDLEWDDNITRNMRGYYAFSWWRYEYSLHPMTTSVIFETGFLTNPGDRELLTEDTELVADAISEGIVNYLTSKSLL